MVKKLILAANWKLHITDYADAKTLASAIKRAATRYGGVDVVLFPTTPFITGIASSMKRSSVVVGAQSISPFVEGARTGYESAAALRDVGATWALVGHSERRATALDGVPAAGESETVVQAQVQAALEAGLKVMLCIGETERDPNGTHFAAVERQLSSALAHVSKPAGKLVIAYEPVWAIGKSGAEACKPADLEEMSIFIRRTLTEIFDRPTAAKLPILYGGSVDESNARDLLVQGGVSGFLIGRASTHAASFSEILKAVTSDSH